jgi:hypothetical protein
MSRKNRLFADWRGFQHQSATPRPGTDPHGLRDPAGDSTAPRVPNGLDAGKSIGLFREPDLFSIGAPVTLENSVSLSKKTRKNPRISPELPTDYASDPKTPRNGQNHEPGKVLHPH